MSQPEGSKQLRLVFMGTPDLAATILRQLLKSPELSMIAVVSQPDRPKGRNLELQAPPVKVMANGHHIPVLQPERARDEKFIGQLKEFAPDLIIVAAFGQILPPAILDLPKHGCLNVHTSLLPKYRGAAPIQRAILNGDTETGVTIMKMDPGMDTGPMVSQRKTPITAEDTGQTLHDRLAELGADLLLQTIPEYIAGRMVPTPQSTEGASYAPKIKKSDGQIDWSRPAEEIWNKIRGLIPWPGAFTHYLGDGSTQLLKVWSAKPDASAGKPGEILKARKGDLVVACGDAALKLLQVQKEGGKKLGPEAFLAGGSIREGQFLGA